MRALAVLGAGGALLSLGMRRPSTPLRIPRLPHRTPGAVVVASLAALTAAGSGAPPAVVGAAAVLSAPIPVFIGRTRRARDLARVAARWPDFLAAVRSRLAAGASVPDATRAAAAHIGGRHLDLTRGPGVPFAQAMAEAREAWADPLADRIFTTLAAAAQIGGRHVDAVVSALAASVADELRLRRAHEAALTEQRLTAGVALVAPWVMLALSLATNPTALASYSTATGSLIVVIGLVVTVVGYALARRTARLSQPPRLFG
jgi:tight adherence protein B